MWTEGQSGLSELSVTSWVSSVEGCPLSGVPLYTQWLWAKKSHWNITWSWLSDALVSLKEALIFPHIHVDYPHFPLHYSTCCSDSLIILYWPNELRPVHLGSRGININTGYTGLLSYVMQHHQKQSPPFHPPNSLVPRLFFARGGEK